MKNFIFGIFTLLAFSNANGQGEPLDILVPWVCADNTTENTGNIVSVNVGHRKAMVKWLAPWTTGSRQVKFSIPTMSGNQLVPLGTFGPGEYVSVIEPRGLFEFGYWHEAYTALFFYDDGGQETVSELIYFQTEPEPEINMTFIEQAGDSVTLEVMSQATPDFGWGRNSPSGNMPCSNFVPVIYITGYNSVGDLVIQDSVICVAGQVTQRQITVAHTGPTDLVCMRATLKMVDISDTPQFEPQTVTQTSELLCVQLQGSLTTSVENQTQNVTRVFPNPFKDILNVQAKNRWSVFNTLGQTIAQGVGNTTLSTSDWKSGIYILEMETNGNISRSPIMRE